MKKFTAIILSAIIFAQTAYAVCAVAQETENKTSGDVIEIHVSPNGNDAKSGDENAPVATFDKARKLARAIRADQKKPINIIFHEGIYRLSDTVNFDSKDSGTEDAPITYKAAENERVIFKGSKVLDTKAFKKVTDPAILKRLPENSREYVGVMDLKTQGIKMIGVVPSYRSGAIAMTGYHQLYLNDRAQTLARFPNSGYTTIKKITNAASKTFQMAEYNVTRWGEAKDARVGGYFLNDYNFERQVVTKINTKDRTLTMNLNGSISGANRRYFVYNLLEEIDMPGEWYIDPDSMLLYYYPQNRISDEVLEISTLSAAMLKLDDVHYVNFEGLEFAQSRYDAIQLPSCTDITFDNCVFRDIEGTGIRDYTDVYRQYQKTPNSYNIVIKNSIFNNIGFTTIALQGGDEPTLTESGNIVENCYFSGVGTEIVSYVPAVAFGGVGMTVKNCTIHNAGAHLIQGKGSLHKIYNNELFDACKEVHDSGAIYAGRNLYQRGVDISNNYIHHVKSLDKSIGEIACGVYMDDRLSEWYIHNNIFSGMSRGVFMNTGNDTEIHDNIFIDNDVGARISGAKGQWAELFDSCDEWVKQYPIYLERFPKIANLRESEHMAHDNHVVDNLFVRSIYEIPEYTGDKALANEDRNNYSTDKFDDFVDEEHGNFEIKENSEILKTHPGLSNIKLDEMGVSKDMLEKAKKLLDRDIVKLYPQNGADNINSAKTDFKWTKSDIYDKYRIVIATDKDMKNVVADEVVGYNYYSTDKLEEGLKTYYWTVTGIDISKENLPDKQSMGSPYRLRTAKYEESEKIVIAEEIIKANEVLSELSVGEEMGQCTRSALDEFKSVIDEAQTVNDSRFIKQDAVDDMTEKLIAARKKAMASRNIGYLSIENWLENQDGWYAGTPTYTDGVMHIEGTEFGYYEAAELPGYQLLKFKMKAKFGGEWTGFGLRQQAPGMAYGVGGVGYMIIIKEDVIEFQRYNSGGGMLKEIKNDFVKNEQWHEYEVGALDTEDGIRVILRVDGKTVLNELDSDGVITEPGHFQIYNRMYAAEHVTDYIEVAKSDDTDMSFDASVVTGKLTAVEPQKVDGFDKLFKSDDIKTVSAVLEKNDTAASYKTETSAESSLISVGGFAGNEVLNIKVKFNLSGEGQGFALRADEDDKEGYRFYVSADKIILKRVSESSSSILAKVTNTYIKDGEFANLVIGAYPTMRGMRVMLYADGNKIIDYTDPYSKFKSTRVNFYDLNKSGMEFQK